jgi:Mitochondrial carrier protein
MIKNEGLASFYKGLKMALIATTASYGSYFFLYRLLKNLLSHLFKLKELSTRHIALITAIAGSGSAAFSNPFWFINTRITLKQRENLGTKTSMMGTVKLIYKEEGIQAFYKGVVANMILVLNPIINFVFYEAIKKYFT